MDYDSCVRAAPRGNYISIMMLYCRGLASPNLMFDVGVTMHACCVSRVALRTAFSLCVLRVAFILSEVCLDA